MKNHFPNSLFGLTKKQIKDRQNKFGSNELQVQIKTPLLKKFLNQFTDVMVLILLGAAFISMFVAWYHHKPEELTDGFVILSIVIVNAVIGFAQEFKTEKALEALKKLVSPQARVIRAGEEQLIPAKELVPGDILVLAEGDKIAADAWLLVANELKVEESSLTGESVPVSKQADPHFDFNSDYTNFNHSLYNKFETLRDECKIFTGTSVATGSAKALVVKIGMNTKFGHIAHLTANTESDKSPLQKELGHIGFFVSKVTFVISGILLLVGILIQQQSLVHSLLFAVSVAVAAVPEGLPATITIALAIGVQKMARKNAIIKQLSSVETLGSTTVICSDKTGTLTKNQMTVKQAWFPAGYGLSFKGTGYAPQGEVQIEYFHNHVDLKKQSKNVLPPLKIIPQVANDFLQDAHKMMSIISFCNDAQLVQNNNNWEVLGDPTEGALLTATLKTGLELDKIERMRDFPFDSRRKRMSVIIRNPNKKYELFVKGAPDSILNQTDKILKEGKISQLTAEDKAEIMRMNNSMASAALRILAIAYRPLDARTANLHLIKKEELEDDLVFVGLIGMIDPPRPEVAPAVKLCHQAGIRTIIITGDYGKTALTIAKDLKIASSDQTKIVTGEELEKINQEQLKQVLNDNYELIFARVSPEHKMIIVDTLKKMDEIVAVTGDGVNDAPALKRADIGVSMGITGTDVSKEAANMILTDDSFASIVSAIREGRTIYQNLRKFVWYIFSCNIGELITIFMAIILKIPAPLTAILILAVDLGTDVLPALALGVDPEEPGIMQLPPRDPQAKIMNKNFVLHFIYMGSTIGLIVIGSYIIDLYQNGWTWGESLAPESLIHRHAATVAFTTLVVIQMINTFNARSEHFSVFKLKTNRYLWGAVGASIAMVICFVHLPFFQEILRTVSLSWKEWLLIVCSSSLVLLIEELRKKFVNFQKKSAGITKSLALRPKDFYN